AAVKRLWQGKCPLPAAITLPEQAANDGNLTWPGQDAGLLGRSADPWLLHCEPEANDFQIPGMSCPAEVSAQRFDQRRTLLQQVNGQLDAVARSGAMNVYDSRAQ